MVGALITDSGAAQQTAKKPTPLFQPEPFWPKALPENWILGQVAGIAIAPDGNIWVLHRPATLLDDEKGATKNPPEYKCCTAPPVLEFDAEGAAPLGKHGLQIDRDGANGQILSLVRDGGELPNQWGRHGRQPGQFKWVHNIAIDAKGSLYTRRGSDAAHRSSSG